MKQIKSKANNLLARIGIQPSERSRNINLAKTVYHNSPKNQVN